MRGKAFSDLGVSDGFRITPAYAGKSYLIEKMQQKKKDHPRLCGEKHRRDFPTVPILGSPPPMRGKGGKTLDAVDLIGITPAYAGKSRFGTQKKGFIGDHPRLCGEKLFPRE